MSQRKPNVAWVVWGFLLAALAGVMAFVPLFGVLGFEPSFVLGIAVGVAGAALGAESVGRWRSGRPASFPGGVPGLYFATLARMLGLLVPPLAILAANALRVKNCNLAGGLFFYALLPGLSAATGTAAGIASGLATRRVRTGALLALGVIVVSAVWGFVRFYNTPPVFAFDPFVGWFPGSLYDEELRISTAFLVARATHLLGAAAALALAAAFLDDKTQRLSLFAPLERRARRGPLAVALGLTIAWLAARAVAAPLIAPDAATIAATLGARRETPHLVLLYSKTGPWAKEIALHAADAEFRYAQLEAALGVSPGRITCYLFDGAADKQRLLGAAHTQIAKPWRREIYLQHESFPHPVLKHELAHIFAGAFGDPLFHVSRRGLYFNVGLVEGVAVAVGDRPGRRTLDEQVKAMRVLGYEPPLRQVFGLGFLGVAPARAYTIAGSFVRFLLAERGPEPLRAVYRQGGSEAGFRAAYGQSFAELAAAWSKRVDGASLDARDKELAAARLRRPSVFHRVCAHELAVRRERAQELAAHGDREGALSLLESVCADEPDDPEALLAVMDATAAAGHARAAERVARRVLDLQTAGDGDKARALIHLGDDHLRSEHLALNEEGRSAMALLDEETPEAPETGADTSAASEDAASYYRRALALSLDEDMARQLRARLIAVENRRIGPALARYLVGDAPVRDPAMDLLRAREVLDADPGDGLGHYLLGRMLYGHEHFAEARAELLAATGLGLPPGGFTIAALRIAGLASLRAGDPPARAEQSFARILEVAEADAGARREAEDFIDRCRYLAAHRF